MNVFRFLCPLWARPPALSGTGPERSIFFALSVYSWLGGGRPSAIEMNVFRCRCVLFGPLRRLCPAPERSIFCCFLCLLLARLGQAQGIRGECVSYIHLRGRKAQNGCATDRHRMKIGMSVQVDFFPYATDGSREI